MTNTYTGVPGAAAVLSRNATPGGGWGQPYGNLDTVDGILATAQPWSGAGPFFSGQSDLLIATGFGFSIPTTENLMRVKLTISWQNGTASQVVQGNAATLFDFLSLYYNGQPWASIPALAVGGPGNLAPYIGAQTVLLFQAPGPNPPTIPIINGSGFGVAIGVRGVVTSLSGLTTSGPGTAPVVGIDQLLLEVDTYADDGQMYNFGDGRPVQSTRNGEFYPGSRIQRDGDSGRLVGDDEYFDPHIGPR